MKSIASPETYFVKFVMHHCSHKAFLLGLIMFFFGAMASSSYGADFVSVAKDGVNVRTKSDTNSPIHMKLFNGYPLKIIEKNGDWLKVSDFESDGGWIENSLTRTNDTVIVVGQKDINLRSEPNATSTIVATVDKGVILKKIGVQGDWLQVRHSSGVTGWIYGKLVWP